MPTLWDNFLVIFIFTMPFLILQIIMSTRKKWFWGLTVPALWTGLGVWISVKNYMNHSRYIKELIIFYLIGDMLLVVIMILIRYRKKIKMR